MCQVDSSSSEIFIDIINSIDNQIDVIEDLGL